MRHFQYVRLFFGCIDGLPPSWLQQQRHLYAYLSHGRTDDTYGRWYTPIFSSQLASIAVHNGTGVDLESAYPSRVDP